MCVQYCGGVQYNGGYFEYHRGYSILRTMEGVQYHGEYHEYFGGCSALWGYHDICG